MSVRARPTMAVVVLLAAVMTFSLMVASPRLGALAAIGFPSSVPSAHAATPVDHTEPIPPSIGHQADRYHFRYVYLNPENEPSEVSDARFQSLARRSSARWGISFDGLAGNRPGAPDGVPVLGFTYSLAGDTLGETTTWIKKIKRKKCRRRRNGRRKCKRVVVGTRIVDQDIAISALGPWQDGPQYPRPTEYDLETTIIHEFGHFAGNDGHVYGCENSPLIDASDTGEWWRAANDWYRIGCPNSTYPRHARSADTQTREFRVIRRTVPSDWHSGPGAVEPRPAVYPADE
jgi:hypothetical protein